MLCLLVPPVLCPATCRPQRSNATDCRQDNRLVLIRPDSFWPLRPARCTPLQRARSRRCPQALTLRRRPRTRRRWWRTGSVSMPSGTTGRRRRLIAHGPQRTRPTSSGWPTCTTTSSSTAAGARRRQRSSRRQECADVFRPFYVVRVLVCQHDSNRELNGYQPWGLAEFLQHSAAFMRYVCGDGGGTPKTVNNHAAATTLSRCAIINSSPHIHRVGFIRVPPTGQGTAANHCGRANSLSVRAPPWSLLRKRRERSKKTERNTRSRLDPRQDAHAVCGLVSAGAEGVAAVP